MVAVQAVEIRTSTAVACGRAAIGVIIRDVDGQMLRVTGRVVAPASPATLAYQAVLRGVWTAKRLGARRIRVLTEDPGIVAQLDGEAAVPADLIGSYLQTKAMLNAYRWSTIELIPREQNTEATLAAAGALERDQGVPTIDEDDLDLLPLWFSAERSPETVGRH